MLNCNDLRVSKKDDFQKSQRYISKCDKVYSESSAYENLYEFKDDTRYKYTIRDFRKKGGETSGVDLHYTYKIVVDTISRNMGDAICETEKKYSNVTVTQQMLKGILDFACKNQGVGNVEEKIWNDAFPEYNGEFYIAKNLSYQYQKICKEHHILTGRVENYKEPYVGMRLKKIPTEIHN